MFWNEGDGGLIEYLWEYSFFFNLLKEFQEDGHQPLWRTVWRYLRNLYIELPYDPAIPLLGMYPDKTLLKRHTHPHVHCSTIHNSQDMETT